MISVPAKGKPRPLAKLRIRDTPEDGLAEGRALCSIFVQHED
jgi:hypothetical protein